MFENTNILAGQLFILTIDIILDDIPVFDIDLHSPVPVHNVVQDEFTITSDWHFLQWKAKKITET